MTELTEVTPEQMEAIKAVVAVPLSAGMAYDKAKADGKIDLKDAPLLVDVGTKIVAAFSHIGEFLGALKAVETDDSKRAELNSWVAMTFDIADDKLEKRIEDGLKLAGDLAAYLLSW